MTRSHSLAALVSEVGGRVRRGDPNRRVTGLQALDRAGPDQLSFYEGLAPLPVTRAGAVLIPLGLDVPRSDRDALPTLVAVEAPRVAVARLLPILHPPARPPPGIHPSATVDPTARLGARVTVGAGAVVAAGAELGDDVILHPAAQVLDGARVGPGSVLFSRAVVMPGCEVGARCRLLVGAVVGSEGYGFVAAEGADGLEHLPLPQLGRAVLEDDVRLGAHACVDRATFGETRVGRGTKIDNLVQVGHNARIGPGCLLVAQSGVAGSTRIEAGAILAAQAGVSGHLTIGAGAVVGGQSGVVRDVPAGARVLGSPAVDKRRFFREAILGRRLGELFARVARLERALSGRPRSKEENDP